MGALQKVTESSAPALRGPYTIADYIVARMKAEGLSQRTVAKNTGYDRCRINRILRDENRLPISIVEAEAILASMGAGALEVALANDMITNNEPVSAEDMAAVVALIAVVVQGLPMKVGAPQGLSYGQRQSEQMVNKSLSVAAKYIKFRGFVRLDELEVTGSPLVMFHPRSS
jgi:transcriptional regulator with XRE-family HTH domain